MSFVDWCFFSAWREHSRGISYSLCSIYILVSMPLTGCDLMKIKKYRRITHRSAMCDPGFILERTKKSRKPWRETRKKSPSGGRWEAGRRTRRPGYCMVLINSCPQNFVILLMRFTLHKWQISSLHEDIQRIHPLLGNWTNSWHMGWLEGPLATARAGVIFTGWLTTVADEVGRI